MKTVPLKTRARIREGAFYVLLTIVVALMLIPFVWVVSGAFKSQGEFLGNPGAWFPESFGNLENFARLFGEKGFGLYLRNSAIVSAVAVLGNLVFASMAGYALAKFSFRGKRLVFGMVMAGMTIPYVALFVPQFLIVVQLQLVDTLAGIVIPIIVMPLGVFIMRQYAYSIPDELFEAARMDGAGEFRIFVRVFLPLVGPALATVAILVFLFAWNLFLWPLIVAQTKESYTAPVGLAIASQSANTTDYGVLLAGAVVVLLPVLILFLFLQRYFIQGVAATGLK